MVLCAGFGTRLGELTREVPKPMLMLAGHPLLAYILGHIQQQGIEQVAINLHFKPETICGYFGDGSRQGIQIIYSPEPHLLGTAGGVKSMESFFRSESAFLVQYGDVITDQDFSAMFQFHLRNKALATLLLHQRASSNSIVTMDERQRIIRFLERPNAEARAPENSPWVNSGVCICDPQMLEAIPSGLTCDLPRDIFPKLIHTGRVFGFPLNGYRCAIDSPARLAEAASAISRKQCNIRPLGAADAPQAINATT